MGGSLRYLGCAVGFGFGVVFMTLGLGSAVVCLLLAGLGYGVVFMAQRAEAKRPWSATSGSPSAEVFELDDAAAPLAGDEYGWPWPRDDEKQAEQDPAPVTASRG